MINAAIVGLGWWGKTLVESVQGTSGDIQFVAGATRTKSPETLAFAEAQRFRLADNYAALLADPKVDAVVLATPHSLHAQELAAAAAAGKHVFCEKPFALTKADAEASAEAARKAGITLGLGQVLRITLSSEAFEDENTVRPRFAWFRYGPTTCNPQGVCRQTMTSQGTTAPVNINQSEAASFDMQGTGGGVRVAVFVAAGDVTGDALIINSATGEVVSHVIMANTEG